MRPSLLICPVGNPIPNNPEHWRYGSSLYEVMVVCYNDLIPEEDSYTHIRYMKGMKWSMAKTLLNEIDLNKYEYIGFIDDDLIMNKADIESALIKANKLNSKLFQLSVDKNSDCWYKILHQNDLLEYSVTNFIEVMAPFIHTSELPIVQKFWSMYDINTGWGLDKVLCYITMCNATVFHDVCMIHPKKQVSDYNKQEAFAEEHKVLTEIYPTFMKMEYGLDVSSLPDQQILSRKIRT